MNRLEQLGVYDAILDYATTHIGENGGILELRCGGGDFAEFLSKKGVKNYNGVDSDVDALKNAKSRLPIFKRRFKKSWRNQKSDIIVCLNGTPFDQITTGSRMAVLTGGFDDYNKLIAAISPLYKPGSKTVQHGEFFLTFGVRA